MIDLQYIATMSDVDLNNLHKMVNEELCERAEIKHKRAWEDVRKAIAYYIQHFGSINFETKEDIISVGGMEDLQFDTLGTIGIKCDEGDYDNW